MIRTLLSAAEIAERLGCASQSIAPVAVRANVGYFTRRGFVGIDEKDLKKLAAAMHTSRGNPNKRDRSGRFT